MHFIVIRHRHHLLFSIKYVKYVSCIDNNETHAGQLERFNFQIRFVEARTSAKCYFRKRRFINAPGVLYLPDCKKKNLLIAVMQESIAYFPLVVLVTGVLASSAVKPLNRRLGSKVSVTLRVLVVGWLSVD